jgi:stress response protein YsnF
MATPTAPRDGRYPDPDTALDHQDAYGTDARTQPEQVLSLVEEAATVHTREVVTGKVRVRTLTDAIEELARANLKSNAVEVTRVPVDKVVESAPEIRSEGDLTIVPVLEEVLVVTKHLVLKEELYIRRRAETETVEVPVTLRKQRDVVERELPDGSNINEETDP